MSRKLWFAIFVIPNMRAAVAYLRSRDLNPTGADDEAADAIDYALNKLEAWANTPDPVK